MKYAELNKKSRAELLQLCAETRHTLSKERFSVAQKQLKNVRSLRKHKKTIAQILTSLRGNILQQ